MFIALKKVRLNVKPKLVWEIVLGGPTEEFGEKKSFRRKLVRSPFKWVGRVERMEGEQLTKKADAFRVDGRRRRGRPRLRWEDCVKRDLSGVAAEWRTRVRDGGVDMCCVDDSETGSVTEEDGKQQSTTGVGASLTPDCQSHPGLPVAPRTASLTPDWAKAQHSAK